MSADFVLECGNTDERQARPGGLSQEKKRTVVKIAAIVNAWTNF
jgi:hypothetical protein